jgi:hypothetical protein
MHLKGSFTAGVRCMAVSVIIDCPVMTTACQPAHLLPVLFIATDDAHLAKGMNRALAQVVV